MLCLHAVTDEDGHPLENENESGRRLRDYWCTIFQARAEGPRHHQYDNILRYVQKAPDDIRWVIDKNEFDELMASKNESAPAPDGIPYSFVKCAGGWVRGFCFARTNRCWRAVLFLRMLPNLELSLFPSPPISTTMEGLLDHRRPYAR